MPRSTGIAVAAIAVMIICAGIAGFVLRADDAEPSVWTWLFPGAVALGLLPVVLNALVPQRVAVDRSGISAVRWFGRQRLAWTDVVEVISYSNGQDLFLRVRTKSSRILLSTRWYGWDGDDLRGIARDIDAVLDEHHPDVERPGTLDRFPSWFSKESGLSGRP